MDSDALGKLYVGLGKRLKARRRELGLKQKGVAAKAGLSRGTVASIETGRQQVAVHQVYDLARALEIDAMHLLSDLQPSVVPSESEIKLKLDASYSDVQQSQVRNFVGKAEREFSRPRRERNGP